MVDTVEKPLHSSVAFAWDYTFSMINLSQVRTQAGFGMKISLEFDMLQKLYHFCEGDQLFSHTFYLLICRLNANTTE